jgi:hypothetical protein
VINVAESDRKCEVSLARLKIIVPDNKSVEEYRKLTASTLLYPNRTLCKEKDKTYSIVDEAGGKIPNIDVEIIVECDFKEEDTRMNIDYVRLEGLPKRIAIDEIVYYKPSTGETFVLGK